MTLRLPDFFRRKLLTVFYLAFLSSLVFILSCQQKEEKKTPEVKKDEFAQLNEDIVNQPGNAKLYFRRSQIFLQKNNLSQSYEDILKATKLDSTNVAYLIMLADVSFKELKIQNTVDAFKKAITLDPENKEAHLKLSELYLYVKAYPQCLAQANEALRIDRNIAKAYFIKGFAYKETGDTSKAISSFQTVVELQPEYYDAHIQLGNIYVAKKNRIALEYYNNALRISPNSTEALYNRGLFYQENRSIEKAETDYQNIIKIDPAYADAHYNLGYLDLVYNKDYKSAIVHFTDAIRINDNYVEAFFNRGVCYEYTGDLQAAEKDYRHALSIVPNYKLAKDRLSKIVK